MCVALAVLSVASAAPGIAQDRAENPADSAAGHDVDPAILELEGDADYGAYLAGECTTCHQVDGGAGGLPAIVHLPRDAFVTAMHAYRNKTRAHPIMQMVAGRLGDAEIAALAAYFTSLDQ